MSGFQFHETMQGTWRRGDEERAIRLTVDVRAAHLGQWVQDDFRANMEGWIEVNGLAKHAPLVGHMKINPVLGRVIGYDFSFTGDDGKTYRFAGQKDIRFLEIVRTMTTLPGAITDETGAEIGTALLNFDLRDLPSFLASWRPLVA